LSRRRISVLLFVTLRQRWRFGDFKLTISFF